MLAGAKIFPSLKRGDGLWGSVPSVPGIISSGLKRPGREDDHLPPSSAEVKNEWSYTSCPPLCPCGLCRDNFAFSIRQCQVRLFVSHGKNLLSVCH